VNYLKNIAVNDIFPKYLFWEYKIELLDFTLHKDLIIPRALYFSTKETFEKDIIKLEEFYTKREILQCIHHTKELISNEVCELVANRYNASIHYRFIYSK
jgi:hypothetical protein